MRILIITLSVVIFSCGRESKTNQQTTITAPKDTTIINESNIDGDPSFIVSDVTSTHGPRSITRNVLQDKNGNIWLATWDGIIQYDGKIFTNFTLKYDLVRYHVFSILEDKKGNIWFGTVGGGVYRYSPSNSSTDEKSFTHFTTSEGLVNNSVFGMLEDKTGSIWFATREGVSRFDGNTFSNFTKQEGLGDNFVSCIAEDNSGKLWFGTNGGVSCFDPSTDHYKTAFGATGKSFTDFTINKDHSFHNVRSILTDKKGNIWIGSDEGLLSYNGKTVTNFLTNSISYIFQDKSGNLWLNGNTNGGRSMTLTKFDGKTFSKIKSKSGSKDPFSNQVFGGTEDRDGKIWFGTASGVIRYDPASGEFNNFSGGN